MPKRLLLTVFAALMLALSAPSHPRMPMWMDYMICNAMQSPPPMHLADALRVRSCPQPCSFARARAVAPLWECHIVDHTAVWSVLPWW